jgi:transposase
MVARKPWSNEELEIAADMLRERKTCATIAKTLGRTRQSVQDKMQAIRDFGAEPKEKPRSPARPNLYRSDFVPT